MVYASFYPRCLSTLRKVKDWHVACYPSKYETMIEGVKNASSRTQRGYHETRFGAETKTLETVGRGHGRIARRGKKR